MNFSNYFLISMPHMADNLFGKSLIYMCEHDEKGAMGFIVNKPFPNNKMEAILQQTGLHNILPHPDIYFGGPVNLNNGFFLHNSKYSIEGTHQISDDLSITSNNSVIKDIENGKGPDNYRFSLGYTGWSAGQLNKEVENGDWLVMPSSKKIIFETPDEKKWEKAAKEYGIDILNLSGQSGLA